MMRLSNIVKPLHLLKILLKIQLFSLLLVSVTLAHTDSKEAQVVIDDKGIEHDHEIDNDSETQTDDQLNTQQESENTDKETVDAQSDADMKTDEEGTDNMGMMMAAGALENLHLNLRFQQGELNTTLHQNDRYRASAKIRSEGSGSFYANWEIAKPPFSNTESPIFTPIKRIHTVLLGKKVTEFFSPNLPTQQAGKYLVRFDIRSPGLEQTGLLTYRVLSAKTDYKIKLLSPETRLDFYPDSVFNWQIQPYVKQALLQIFVKDGFSQACEISPSEAYLIAIATNHYTYIKITPIAADKLQQGQAYCWRVQAYKEGTIVAVSEARTFIWQIQH
jgi:hypothetical protein